MNITSSPEGIFARSPTPVGYSPEQLFGLSPQMSSPSSLWSPSELLLTPPRSRSDGSAGTTKSPENASIVITGADDPNGKLKRVSKESVEEQQKFVAKSERVRKILKITTGGKGKGKGKGRPSRNSKMFEGQGNRVLESKVTKKRNNGQDDSAKQAAVLCLPEFNDLQDADMARVDGDENGLHLEAAPRRRLDWTPKDDSKRNVIHIDGDDISPTGCSFKGRKFDELIFNYGFKEKTGISQDVLQSRKITNGDPTKKRRIELVNKVAAKQRFQPVGPGESAVESAGQSPPAQFIHRPRSQKRITTITAHATMNYALVENKERTTLHECAAGAEKQTAEKTSNAKRGTSKTKRSKANARKNLEPEYVVVSPKTAAESFADQDFLFGTCSQIERDESPTFVREMQMALRASENSLFTEPSNPKSRNTPSFPSNSPLSRMTSSRSLWSASARDSNGLTIQPDSLEMALSRAPSNALFKNSQLDSTDVNKEQGKQKETPIEIEDSPRGSSKVAAGGIPSKHLAVKESLTVSQVSTTCSSSGSLNNSTTSHPTMPRYNGFTNADLCNQIAVYGFKPVKSRDKMIALLQKCWENMHPGTSGLGDPANEATSSGSQKLDDKQAVLNPTKKSKSITRSGPLFAQANEKQPAIQSRSEKSTSAISSKRTRSKRTPLDTSEIPTSKQIEVAGDPPHNSSSAYFQSLPPSDGNDYDLPDPSCQITKAIYAQPRVVAIGSYKGLTWHEKILLYDPILLEDLAAWLNTEGLGLIGEDREVSAAFVREWCESKGICCCYK